MVEAAPKPSEEREHTDASLRVEREKTDQALAETIEAEDGSEALSEDTEESLDALARLLPLEREKTDRHLLTERARSDEAIAHRDDFLGMVSHDLRNLLGAIVMSATFLAKDAAGSRDEKKTLVWTGRIHSYAARMNRLIGDLLDVSRIDAGKLAVNPAVGSPSELLREAVDMFRPTASAAGLSLEAEWIGPPTNAEFDHDRMMQVLINLITNSIKFTTSGGRVLVRGERVEDGVRFSVRDSGSGVPSGQLDAIFERFWQVGTSDRKGLGLGLHISKCIVEAHGGRIWAESKVGEGTTVYFTLPLARAHEEQARVAS